MKKVVQMMILIATVAGISSCNSKKTNNDILFLNVDTQVDFMKSEGKLYVQNAETIATVLAKLTALAKENNIRVVNTCDYHNENSKELSDTPDFINTFPPHCMQNTKGQEFIKETTPENPIIFDWDKDYEITKESLSSDKARNIVIRKDVFDVFKGNKNTERIFETLAPKSVFVYGVATNVCVDFAVIGLAKRGYKVYVIEDAIKELPKIPTPFEKWKEEGITFITSNEIQNYL